MKTSDAATDRVQVPVVFELLTQAAAGHSHPEYTHRCDVTLFDRPMWSLWGKSAEAAEHAARFQIAARLGVLRGY